MLYINPSDLNIPLGIITSFTISAQKNSLNYILYGKMVFLKERIQNMQQYYIFWYIHRKFVCL